jgi:hypothetical protein
MSNPVTRVTMILVTAFGVLLCLRALMPPSESASPTRVGTELLVNPTFADDARGWELRNASILPDGGPDGRPAVELAGVEPRNWSDVGIALKSPPCERTLRFTCRLRPDEGGQNLSIDIFTYDHCERPLQSWSHPIALDSTEWTDVSIACSAYGDALRMTLWVINEDPRAVRVADPHWIVGEPKELVGAGVLRASALAVVGPGANGTVGTVTFPIPSTQAGQIPLAFDVVCDPPDALRGFRWVRRDEGLNWSCELKIDAPVRGAAVRWEALVLVPGPKRCALPKAKEAEAPHETRQWLRSTACVQSDDAGIAAKAAELAEGTRDIEAYVRRVVEFTQANGGSFETAKTVDARAALAFGGSRTSRANLAAALLRARGIPARTLSHLPTWTKAVHEHWLVEYWHPGTGWVWAEPSLGELQPDRWTVVALAIASADDEDRSFDECISHSDSPLGIPHRAAPEVSAEIEALSLDYNSRLASRVNWAWGELPLDHLDPADLAALFEAARASFESFASSSSKGILDPERTQRIEAALRDRDAAALCAALR